MLSITRRALVVLSLLAATALAVGAAGCSNSTQKLTKGVLHVRVVNGQPVGGIQNLVVKKGGRVRFTVTSDVADEIHVHGYNFHKDVAKGGNVSFDFPATIDGAFVIELEKRSQQIIALTVEP